MSIKMNIPVFTSAVDSGKSKLLRDLNSVVNDAQALLKELAGSSSHTLAEAPAYVEDRLDRVKSNLQRARNVIENKAKDASRETDRYIHENPWKSMGFATAASLCIGLFLAASMWTGRDKTQKARK